jgi:myosin protein heavy chain
MAARLDDEGRESASIDILQKRLAEELEDEREQHLKDLAERDFAVDQTRKKYQGNVVPVVIELELIKTLQLNWPSSVKARFSIVSALTLFLISRPELQSQRDSMSRLREDNRKIRSDYDELQLRYDDEVYNSGSWKKERERLETKIADINSAYEAATGAQAEQQAQIVSLHSQVRELRGVLNDTETDRALLQKARRALQAELEAIKLNHVDAHKMSSDREFQKLQLRKQDLERSLEEQEDRVAMAFDRMKKAEYFANESQGKRTFCLPTSST